MAKTPQPPKTPPAPKLVQTPAPASEPTKPTSRVDAAEKPDRLTILLTKDGRPDFDSMRDKTREKVRAIVSDPSTARALGISADAAPAVATLPPFVTQAAIVALSQLDTIIVSRVTGAPAPVVLAIAPYTPDEARAIQPALESVLNKYGGPLIGKWGDELALATLLTTITLKKIEAVRVAMTQAPRPPAPVIVHPSAPAPAPAPAPVEDKPLTIHPADQMPPETFQ